MFPLYSRVIGKVGGIYTNSRRYLSVFYDLANIIGIENVVCDDNSKYTIDWLKNYKGGNIACFPKSTNDVVNIMIYCTKNALKIVPQGGNTGLVGGSIPIMNNEIILSLEKMNKIIEIDSDSSVIICDAGCILASLEEAVNKVGFILPLDLGSKGSCMIGGNVSTNAGGLRLLKYGSMHHNVLGLEVVLADGTVLNMLRKLRKDNSGYDLKHLFIGSEGTLGIVTKVALQLVNKPVSVQTLLVSVNSIKHASFVTKLAKQHWTDILTAIEYMDASCVDVLQEFQPDVVHAVLPGRQLSSKNGCAYILLELSAYAPTIEIDRMQSFMDELSNLSSTDVEPTVYASATESQVKNMWCIRESIPGILPRASRSSRIQHMHDKTVLTSNPPCTVKVSQKPSVHPLGDTSCWVNKFYKYDISIDLKQLGYFKYHIIELLRLKGYSLGYDAMHPEDIESRWQDDLGHDAPATRSEVFSYCNSAIHLDFYQFGHLGDGNIHVNILLRLQELQVQARMTNTVKDTTISMHDMIINQIYKDIDDVIYMLTMKLNGSISAEHGIGQLKKEALLKSKSPEELQVMRSMKALLDPSNRLNPGKIL